MKTWATLPFLECASDASAGNLKVSKSDYQPSGKYAIIDQGKNLIAGYTNDPRFLYSGDLPVVIFGDHTRTFKYVDFPFCMGADGVKILRPRPKIDAKYLYHSLLCIDIPNAGYSRHFKFLKESNIVAPPLDEQRRIAQVLDSVDTLRVKRREAITLLDDLVQSIFLDAFGDPATNPKRWDVESLGDLARVIRGASPRPKGDPKYFGGLIPWLMISDVTRSPGDTVTEIREGVTAAGRDKSVYLKTGTLILTNSATVGLPKFLGVDACIHDGFLAILDISEKIDPMYLYQLFKQNREKISSLAPEGTQKNLNTGIAKALSVPVPPLAVQHVFRRSIEQINLLRSRNEINYSIDEAMV